MFLKRWPVIAVLLVIGLGLLIYWLSLPRVPEGLVAQGDGDDLATSIAALAGAITTLGTAAFAMLSKWNEYRKEQLDVRERELELKKKEQELNG